MGDAPVNPNEYINIYNRNPLISNYKNQNLLNQQKNTLTRNLNNELQLARRIESALQPTTKAVKQTSKYVFKTAGTDTD